MTRKSLWFVLALLTAFSAPAAVAATKRKTAARKVPPKPAVRASSASAVSASSSSAQAPAVSTPAVAASTVPLQVPWKVGEKLSFNIIYGILDAGEATLTVKNVTDVPELEPKVQAYHFVATARSTPFVDVFYKVRDRNESWLDTNRWLSHRFEQHNHEGKYILDQVVQFDWRNLHFKDTENVKGRAPKVEEGPLSVPALDTLSVLYAARSRPLKEGEEFSLDVHSGRYWPISVKVLKRETVKVPAGTFDCFLVEPYLRERGLFVQKGKKLWVWMTADDRHIPVKMRAEIFIGSVAAELTRIDGN